MAPSLVVLVSNKTGVRMNRSAKELFMVVVLGVGAMVGCGQVIATSPVLGSSCTTAWFGSLTLTTDDQPPVQATIVSAAPATTAPPLPAVPYCLVKVLVGPQAINIWVGLPNDWNNRWQSVGGSGYAGTFGFGNTPDDAIAAGYAGATTDTGHIGGVGRPFPFSFPGLDGSFGCVNKCAGNNANNPGQPNVPLQKDFAYRSEHLMAVLGKEVVQAYYGQLPIYSYWNGCSTGGRQGLRMAQDYPNDYDGILAGAPAIHWDRFQAGQIWYQMVQNLDNGGPIGGGDPATLEAKENLATGRAVAACDLLDGVTDGVLTDPRMCTYSAAADSTITKATCTASDPTCLTPAEASAIDKMWKGPVTCSNGHPDASCPVPDFATRNLNGKGNKRLWYPNERGTDLTGLGDAAPFPITTEQPQYWVYFDPTWDWHTLTYANYLGFFGDTVEEVGPIMASDNPNLAPFRDHGGKLVLWHGFADQLIVPEGTIDYYDAVTQTLGGGYNRTEQFARLFMAPGVGHCGGGNGPQPQGLFDAVVNWVEHNQAPATIAASVGSQTRPLCPYPTFAVYDGTGDPNLASSFSCGKLH